MVLVFVYVIGSGMLQLQNLLSYEFSLLINKNIQMGGKLSILRHTFIGTFFSWFLCKISIPEVCDTFPFLLYNGFSVQDAYESYYLHATRCYSV